MGTERKKNEGSGEWREAESFIIEENLAAAEGTMGSFSPARASGFTGRVGGCGGLGNEEESMGNFLKAATPVFLLSGIGNKSAFASLA